MIRRAVVDDYNLDALDPLCLLLQPCRQFTSSSALFRVQTMIDNFMSKSSIHRLDHFEVDLLVY